MNTFSPINKANTLSKFLKCTDFTVSRETFTLLIDKKSELLITSPQPSLENLPSYYESSEYISHTDSKKSLFDKIYQIVKKYTISKKIKLVKSLLKDIKLDNVKPKILDIGCGTGDFLVACDKKEFEVFGVEPNVNAKNIAKQKIIKTDFTIQNSIFDLDINVKYDVITMWHVLEHVPDLEKYISKLKSLLQPNGILIIAVPNYKSYDAKYYKEFWAAYDVPRHLWHFSKKSISLLFSKVAMQVKFIYPMKLDSFYVSLLSEKYKTGKSNFIKAFYIGLLSNIRAKSKKEYSSLIYVLKK